MFSRIACYRLSIWLIIWICLCIINNSFSLSSIEISFSERQVLLLILSLNGSVISQRYLTLSDPRKLDGSRTFTRVLWRECRLMRHRYLEEIIDPIQATEKTQMSINDSAWISRRTIICRAAIIEKIIYLLRIANKKERIMVICYPYLSGAPWVA